MKTMVVTMMALGLAGCGGSSAPQGPVEPEATPPEGGGETAEACPRESGGDAPDGIDGALRLETGDNPGCFAVGDTKDTYALESAAGAHTLYKITYEGHAAAQGCLEFYDAAKKEARWTDRCAPAPGGTHTAWALVAPGSRWFLQVRDLTGSAGSEERGYRLAVEAVPVADTDEPNGTAAEARPVSLDAPKASWFFDSLNGPERETDNFKVTVAKAGLLSATLENGDPSVQFAVKVIDASGKTAIEKGAENAGATLTVNAKVKPGDYVLEVRNIAGTGTPPVGKGEPPRYATQPYKLTVTVK